MNQQQWIYSVKTDLPHRMHDTIQQAHNKKSSERGK